MKRFLGISLVLLLSHLSVTAAVAPYIQIRSQTVDSARELMGWTQYVNLFDQERVYGVTAATLEYTQSFDAKRIAQSLFNDELQCTSNGMGLVVSGSQYPNRNVHDLLADYFGLPTDFRSIVTFNPSIRNIILDLNFYLGLDQWLCGLYFRIHAPIVHSWWNLNYKESITNKGTNSYAAGYYSPQAVNSGLLLGSFGQYVSCQMSPTLTSTYTFIDESFESLKSSRMSQRGQSLTRLSEIEAAFGWNFVQCDNYHFGLSLRVTAPTGNRPNPNFLFSPMIGNGHHWGLGVGLTSHWQLWRNDSGDKTLGLYADANIGTLFKTNQTRVFDLKNKPLSRYMIAELLGSPVTNLFGSTMSGTDAGTNTAPNLQFQGVFRPVANLTTISVLSSYPAQVDITLLLDYTQNSRWSFDIGLNFWALACEKLKPSCCVSPLTDNSNWALKGDAFVYGFVAANAATPSIAPGSPVALSATENSATINAGTNTPANTLFNASQLRNPNIDNPQYAMVATTDPTDQLMFAPGLDADSPGVPVNQQRTSVNPILIATTDLDIDGARTDGLSYKVFAHFNYMFDSMCGWTPYVGVGGKVEFARHLMTNCCATVCDGCLDTNVSEWGIWAKGGFAF